MKGDQRHRLERRARKEMNHARRQAEFYLDKLMTTGQTHLYEGAYREARAIYQRRLIDLEALEKGLN